MVDLRTDRSPFVAALDGIDVVVNRPASKTPAWWRPPPTAPRSSTSPPRRPMWRRSSGSPAGAVVLSVGLAPGLTNLLAAAVHQAAPGPRASTSPSSSARASATGRRGWRGRSRCWGAGSPIPPQARACATTRRGVSTCPAGHRRLYRADFSDQHVLTRDLGVAVRTTSASTARAATATLAALTWVPGGSHVPQGLHLPGGDRWLALAQQRGRHHPLGARGRLQSHATAVLAVARCPAGRRAARRRAPPAQGDGHRRRSRRRGHRGRRCPGRLSGPHRAGRLVRPVCPVGPVGRVARRLGGEADPSALAGPGSSGRRCCAGGGLRGWASTRRMRSSSGRRGQVVHRPSPPSTCDSGAW